MRNILMLAVLLVVAVIVVIFFDLSNWFITVVLVFWRGVAFRFVRDFIILKYIPKSWRHRYNRGMRKLNELLMTVIALWKVSNWSMRLTLIVAMCAGSAVYIALGAPVNISRIPFVGLWLRDRALPALMRTAAAKSIEAQLPFAWRRLPEKYREHVAKPYRHYKRLWYRTRRVGVNTGQMSSRHLYVEPQRQITMELDHRDHSRDDLRNN